MLVLKNTSYDIGIIGDRKIVQKHLRKENPSFETRDTLLFAKKSYKLKRGYGVFRWGDHVPSLSYFLAGEEDMYFVLELRISLMRDSTLTIPSS